MQRINAFFEENSQKRLTSGILHSSALNSPSLRDGGLVDSFCTAAQLFKSKSFADQKQASHGVDAVRHAKRKSYYDHGLGQTENLREESIFSERYPARKICLQSAANVMLQRTSPRVVVSRTRWRRKAIKPQSNNLLKYFKPTGIKQLKPSDQNDPSTFSDRVDSESSLTTDSNSHSQITEDYPSKKHICDHMNEEDVTNVMGKTSPSTIVSRNESSCNMFGLLGLDLDDCSDFSDNECEDNFAPLPSTVMEVILCQLPLCDLLLNFTRVCRLWNEIISAPGFIPWKKRYHMFKINVKNVATDIEKIASSAGINSLDSCLLKLIVYMNSFAILPVQGALPYLQRHRKYASAMQLLADKVPECTNDSANLWVIVATLVVLSETMWDIYDILKHLTKGPCPIYDAVEALYCISTLLLHVKRKFKVGYGLHYRVYYALYAFENDWTAKVSDLKTVNKTVSGQKSLMSYGCQDYKLKLTNEQMRIINHSLQPSHIVKIIAFAGSGKTSTLVEFARMNPHLKFLAVMYNKAVADHAKMCFPVNVECRTSHSLAWKSQGSRLKGKLTPKIRPLDILGFLESAPSNYGRKQRHARCVITTLESFMASADEFISTTHSPTMIQGADQESGTHVLSDDEKQNVANDAKIIWQKMKDHQNFDVLAVHDCYLKLYHLERPVLYGYDCIFIDEAQDCNPAILDLLLSQSCAKIVVGDPNQQIYAFRGAINALDKVIGTHVYYLTQSFRFGPEIAHVASLILEVLKRQDHKTLIGGTQSSSVAGTHVGQVGILARSNIVLFNEVVRMLFSGSRRTYDPDYIIGAFAGGMKGYGLDQLVDLYHMLEGNKEAINDRFVKRFQSIGAMQVYATNVNDMELLGKIRLVKQYGNNIPDYICKIKERCRTDLSMANVVFSTVHKAKGLEFDTVVLLEDFLIGMYPYNGAPDEKLDNEYNVLYVGVTRAKKSLCMPPILYYMLLGAQERMEYPTTYSEDNPNAICCKCSARFSAIPGKLILVRRRLQLVGSNTIMQGYFCSLCSQSEQFMPEVNHPLVFGQPKPLPNLQHKLFSQLLG